MHSKFKYFVQTYQYRGMYRYKYRGLSSGFEANIRKSEGNDLSIFKIYSNKKCLNGSLCELVGYAFAFGYFGEIYILPNRNFFTDFLAAFQRRPPITYSETVQHKKKTLHKDTHCGSNVKQLHFYSAADPGIFWSDSTGLQDKLLISSRASRIFF